jgi:very-short-patch-repair endonuclease
MFTSCAMSRIQPLQNRRARQLRRKSTYAEDHLWQRLRAHRLGGWKWKRQVPFGPFILDFLCVDAGLVIELDGGCHEERWAYDLRRTSYLQARGLRVIRFPNDAVLRDADEVCTQILRACPPSPSRGCAPGEREL